jgi:hypothetical protein
VRAFWNFLGGALGMGLLIASGVALAQLALPANTKTITVTGLCDTWQAWKVGSNLHITCGPEHAKPVGGVELRPFYVVPANAGRR